MKSAFSNWVIAKFANWLLKEEPPRRAYLSDYEQIKKVVKPCDVLLIEGRSRASYMIQLITRSPWSHASLYIGKPQEIIDSALSLKIKEYHLENSEEPLLIESEIGKGTILSPLSKYKEDHIRILRPHGLQDSDKLKIIRYTFNRLGKEYSIRHIFDLARFIFPWGLYPRNWRSSLFQQNALQPTEDICSSMLADAFHSIGFPILPLVKEDLTKHIELIQRNPRLFTPSDFDFSPYFDVIKYPIFDLGKDINLDALPWKKGVISDDVDVLRHIDDRLNKD